MKRWSRSIPFLLAVPLVLLSWLLLPRLLPTSELWLDLLCSVSFFLLLTGQSVYLLLRDKDAAIIAAGTFFLLGGLVFAIWEGCFGFQGFAHLTRQQLFAVHCCMCLLTSFGWATTLQRALAIEPRYWWATFQAWQREANKPVTA